MHTQYITKTRGSENTRAPWTARTLPTDSCSTGARSRRASCLRSWLPQIRTRPSACTCHWSWFRWCTTQCCTGHTHTCPRRKVCTAPSHRPPSEVSWHCFFRTLASGSRHLLIPSHPLSTWCLLKCMFVDTVYMNVMQVDTAYEGPNYLMCDDIEEYLRFEQHRLSVVQRVREEDMSIENRYYGEMLSLQRVTVEWVCVYVYLFIIVRSHKATIKPYVCVWYICVYMYVCI